MLNLVKDFLFYGIGLILVLLYGFIEKVSFGYALIFFSVYIFYIVISLMFFNDKEENLETKNEIL